MNKVKRYMQHAHMAVATGPLARLYPGATQYVLAADHDRIVSCMAAGREAVERENTALRTQARALEQTALELRDKVDRLQAELAVSHADASHYASASAELGTTVERLRKDSERITWLAAQARMIYGHKGEASYQLGELQDLIQSSREECRPDDLRRAIDEAMENSPGSD